MVCRMQALRTLVIAPVRVDPINRTRVEDHMCYIVDFFPQKPYMTTYRDVVKAS